MLVKEFFETKRKTGYYDVRMVNTSDRDNKYKKYMTNSNEIAKGILDFNVWSYAHIESWDFDGNTFELEVAW